MHPLRRRNAVGALAVAIFTLALAAPVARHPTPERLETSRPVPTASILDTAADIVERAAVEAASSWSWQRPREPVLDLGVAAAVAIAVAAAALCVRLRSTRDRLRAATVTANGMRAPPGLRALS